MNYVYWRDEESIVDWITAQKQEESTQEYLDKFIYGVKNNDEYLDLIGREKLQNLKDICKGR